MLASKVDRVLHVSCLFIFTLPHGTHETHVLCAPITTLLSVMPDVTLSVCVCVVICTSQLFFIIIIFILVHSGFNFVYSGYHPSTTTLHNKMFCS